MLHLLYANPLNLPVKWQRFLVFLFSWRNRRRSPVTSHFRQRVLVPKSPSHNQRFFSLASKRDLQSCRVRIIITVCIMYHNLILSLLENDQSCKSPSLTSHFKSIEHSSLQNFHCGYLFLYLGFRVWVFYYIIFYCYSFVYRQFLHRIIINTRRFNKYVPTFTVRRYRQGWIFFQNSILNFNILFEDINHMLQLSCSEHVVPRLFMLLLLSYVFRHLLHRCIHFLFFLKRLCKIVISK